MGIFSKFIVRFISIGLAVFILGSIPIIQGIIYILLAGLIIESIRRIVRVIMYGRKFRIGTHFLFWVIFQAGFFYLGTLIVEKFYLEYWPHLLILTLIISILNMFLKIMGLEDIIFSSFKIKSHGSHKNKRESYYDIGLRSVPSDVLRSWRRNMSKRNFRSNVESSGYKAVHGG